MERRRCPREVEQLIAAAGIVVDAAVRIELAEDLTARTMARCVPLLDRDGGLGMVPEHVRAWTSRPVLDVEADLTARFAARSRVAGADARGLLLPHGGHAGLDAGQAAAIAALAGDRRLVVVEGAAGRGQDHHPGRHPRPTPGAGMPAGGGHPDAEGGQGRRRGGRH